MKRIISVFAVSMLLCFFSSKVYAQYGYGSVTVASGQTIHYHYYSSTNTISIIRPSAMTSYSVSGALIIPDSITHDGVKYPVTAIESGAFVGCSGLTSVTIPDGVNSIGYNVFKNCSGLTSVTIPEGITDISGGCFYGCSSLTSVTIPNSTTWIQSEAFRGCHSLSSVTIPEGVRSIDDYAFCGCIGLTSVTIPEGVHPIGDHAFSYCSGLTSVTIGSGVTSIGEGAFSNCSGLTTVYFNAVSCANFSNSNFNHPFEYTPISNFILGDSVRVIPAYLCRGRSGLTSITIPDGVTSIGNYAFSGCSGLTSVTIGSGITTIGNYAFYNCIGLTSVTIPDGVTSIGNYAFSGCSGLTSVTIGSGITSIGNSVFSRCSGLTSVIIGSGVTSIGDHAFQSCTSLPSVTIPEGVASIGDYAFENCTSLDTIYMKPLMPPTLGGLDVFSSNGVGRVFILYGCSYDNYYSTVYTPWNSYRNALREPIIDINVNVLSSDSTCGTAAVILGPNNRIVRCDSTAVVQATFNHGYHFDHWSNSSTANPDTITLTGDTTITAYFERDSYNLIVTVNDTTLGTISTPIGTSALYHDTLMVVATPIAHHHVVMWQGIDIVFTSANKDTVWVKMLNDHTITCNFAIDTHTVSVTTNDIARGMVETSGTEFVYGTPCTVTATAYSGYIFQNWSNGITNNPYTFAVLEDIELTAVFILDTIVEGIDGVETVNAKIYTNNRQIVVEGADGNDVCLYDVNGRILAIKQDYGMPIRFDAPASGTYIIKIGNYPVRKVVVIR